MKRAEKIAEATKKYGQVTAPFLAILRREIDEAAAKMERVLESAHAENEQTAQAARDKFEASVSDARNIRDLVTSTATDD